MNSILAFVTWSVDPVAFSIGSLQVRWYGILLATGFILAYLALQKIFRKENLSQKLLDHFVIWTIVWTIVGLRLGHFLFYEPEYLIAHPLQVLLPVDEQWHFIGYQGLASHGAAIAILIWLIYYTWTRKMNFCWLLDRVAIAVPIAAAFVRLGNLMNHEIVGSITNVPWAFDFMLAEDPAGTFRHPSQLYESLVYLTLFIILISRFFIEFLKADQVAKEADMALNIGQKLSIPLTLLGIGLLIYSIIKKEKIPHYVEPQAPKKK